MSDFNDLLNLVNNVKEKITDDEYNEITKNIEILNKNKQQLYNITFIKTCITHKSPDSVIVNNILRTDKVYLDNEILSCIHDTLLDKYCNFQYKEHTDGTKIIIEEDNYTDNEAVIIFEDDNDVDEYKVNGWVFYHQYTLVDIKKV